LTQKKFLFISYAFPHFKAVGSFRSYYIAQKLASLGSEVSVITTKNYDFLPKQVLPIYKEIKLKRIHSFDYNFIKGFLKRGKKNSSNTSSNKNSYSLSFRILDTFPFNIIMGLGGLLYIILALIYILPRIKGYSHIYSSFRPYSDHFIAYVLKFFKKDLYWIADFRDIHIDKENKNVLSIKYQNFINKKLFKKANLLTSVSQGYLNALQEYNSNSIVLFNGYDDSLVEKFNNSDKIQFQKFTISHVGSLYGGRRDPSFLFEVIQDLIEMEEISREAICLNYVGSDGELWMKLLKKFNLADLGQDMGSVDHQKAIQVQKSSDINLMITWATTEGGTFPAKFFEYLVSDRPVLLLINGENDEEFENIFNTYKIGSLVYARSSYRETLKDFIKKSLKSRHDVNNIDPKILTDFHWNNRIQTLLQAI